MVSKDTIIKIEDSKYKLTEGKSEINILCFDLSHMSTARQFVYSCICVFVCYLLYGFFLELVFTEDNVKPISLYISLIQFLIVTGLSYIESLLRKHTERKVPLKTYTVLAVLTLGTMSFSNLALSYLNYPTQLIFKSCKLIPVMIGSIVIQGKRYSFLDYLAAVVMSVGLTMFTLADSTTSPHFDFIGVVIISLALLCDAVLGNVQEKIMKQYKATNNEVVFYSYGIASMYLTVFTFFSGTLINGIVYTISQEDELYFFGTIFMLSFSGYVGLQAVLTLLRICGAPITVTVTTMRKALSIVISFLLFTKPFVFQYLWSGLLVVFAIFLNMYSKKNPNYVPSCWYLVLGWYESEYRYLQGKHLGSASTV